jgi:hypothetical protein
MARGVRRKDVILPFAGPSARTSRGSARRPYLAAHAFLLAGFTSFCRVGGFGLCCAKTPAQGLTCCSRLGAQSIRRSDLTRAGSLGDLAASSLGER